MGDNATSAGSVGRSQEEINVPRQAPKDTLVIAGGRVLDPGRNTPFAGWTLKGRVVRTLVGGRTAFAREAVGG